MIDKTTLLKHAKEMRLPSHIIEKDYVIGWALAAIYANKSLSNQWIFKGGTCLKKCYFENYRFSEDLDFKLLHQSHINVTFLHDTFAEIADWIYDHSGILIPHEKITFELYTNKQGTMSCQGKISYAGPLSQNGAIDRWPRIKLDLTANECLVDTPTQRKIFHPYSDQHFENFMALTYSYEEIFAEKTRALLERTRPRDLYDVIYLYQQYLNFPISHRLWEFFEKKLAFKNISLPTGMHMLESNCLACKAAWEDQLAHQLSQNRLPAFDAFWAQLPAFFAWLQNSNRTLLDM